MEQWMRVHAFNRVMGNWDAWTFSVGQNMFLYKQPDVRWHIMPWDIDFVLGLGNGPTDALWGGQDPVGNKIYDTPAFRRMLWRAYQDAVAGPMLPENYGPQVEARRSILLKNNVGGVNAPAAIYSYMEGRRTYIINQLAANNTAAFAITSNNGNNFSTASPLTTLAGTAPFEAADIEINGVTYPLNWIDQNRFQVVVTLPQRTNVLALVVKDHHGQVIPSLTDTITVTYTGILEQPEDHVVMNEIMFHPALPDTEFIELFNTSSSITFDLSQWQLKGADFTFPDGTFIKPQGFVVVAKNPTAFATAYGASIPVAGAYNGNLDHGGETLTLVKPGLTPEDDKIIDQVKYNDKLPGPEPADGFGPSLQLIDPNQDNRRAGNWAASATNASVLCTPGAANSVRANVPAYPLVWLNEVQPTNISGITDLLGHRAPWLELFNSGTNPLALGGFYLANSFTNLTQWPFPSAAVIQPGQFVIVWVDGHPEETVANEWHASFSLDPANGSIALSRLQNGTPAVMDYLNYKYLMPGRAYGSYPDGQPLSHQIFPYPTPGRTNDPASIPTPIFINEWMASNTQTIADPADHEFEDWFELYNAGTNTVDLSAFTLTDDLAITNKCTIPAGTIIEPHGYLLVWADKDPSQNNPTNRDLHVDFKLSQAGEVIGLFAPDGTLVDMVAFGQQTNDISQGRFPDGAPEPFLFMDLPTPRTANLVATTNRPPELALIGDKTVDELQSLQFSAAAVDNDLPAQTLNFSLDPGAPAGAAIDPATGYFSWIPSELQGPGVYSITVRVTDNGTPPLTDFKSFTVIVAAAGPLKIKSLTISAYQQLTLGFETQEGNTYQVQYQDNLADPAWHNLNGPITATNSIETVRGLFSTNKHRFYRIQLLGIP